MTACTKSNSDRRGNFLLPNGEAIPAKSTRNECDECVHRLVVNKIRLLGVFYSLYPKNKTNGKDVLKKLCFSCPVCAYPFVMKRKLFTTKEVTSFVIREDMFDYINQYMTNANLTNPFYVYDFVNSEGWLKGKWNKNGRWVYKMSNEDLQDVHKNFYFHLYRDHQDHPLFDQLMELPLVQRYKAVIKAVTTKYNNRVIEANDDNRKMDEII